MNYYELQYFLVTSDTKKSHFIKIRPPFGPEQGRLGASPGVGRRRGPAGRGGAECTFLAPAGPRGRLSHRRTVDRLGSASGAGRTLEGPSSGPSWAVVRVGTGVTFEGASKRCGVWRGPLNGMQRFKNTPLRHPRGPCRIRRLSPKVPCQPRPSVRGPSPPTRRPRSDRGPSGPSKPV
ncbi:hypothetical protein M885DRAFT_30589 [Pelagophyceae sp. CCMP2097]|nr:hypothetical protein M885DRAFT_30589 [Pelagophyceae sp. CCMP2097]